MKSTDRRCSINSGTWRVVRQICILKSRFRTSPNNIKNICNGFFLDSSHLAKQFAYVTNASDLGFQIEKNLPTQIGRISLFLI